MPQILHGCSLFLSGNLIPGINLEWLAKECCVSVIASVASIPVLFCQSTVQCWKLWFTHNTCVITPTLGWWGMMSKSLSFMPGKGAGVCQGEILEILWEAQQITVLLPWCPVGQEPGNRCWAFHITLFLLSRAAFFLSNQGAWNSCLPPPGCLVWLVSVEIHTF